tara:strand:- start:913 stop:2067 length:1155 start_codon:yes stop_codon:yes gene_type:complete
VIKNSSIPVKILSIFLNSITIILLLRYTLLSSTLKWGTWSYAENLISYPDKFIRRGLLGEIILFLSGDGSAFEIMQIMVFVNCVLLVIMTFLLFKMFGLTLLQHNMLILSSFGMMYLVYHGSSFNRKEIFAINFFLIFIYFLKKNKNTLTINLKIFLLLSSVFTALIHEGLLFITVPFYFLILKPINQNTGYLYLFTSSALLIFLLTQQGSESDAINLWNQLNQFDRNQIGNDLESSAIYAIAFTYERQILNSGINILVLGFLNHWLSILFYFYIYFFITHLGADSVNLKNLKDFFLTKEMLYCLPLFIVGDDWGRYLIFYIYIYYFYLLFMSDSKNVSIHNIAKMPILIIFSIYSFFTIIPEATFKDINIITKITNSFTNLFN